MEFNAVLTLQNKIASEGLDCQPIIVQAMFFDAVTCQNIVRWETLYHAVKKIINYQ